MENMIKIILWIIGISVITGGLYGIHQHILNKGIQKERAVWELRYQEQQKKLDLAYENHQKDVSIITEKYHEAKDELNKVYNEKQKTITKIKYINRNNTCVINGNIIRLHDLLTKRANAKNDTNTSAGSIDEGTTSAKDIGRIMEVVGENYNQYYILSEQTKALQKIIKDYNYQQQQINKFKK